MAQRTRAMLYPAMSMQHAKKTETLNTANATSLLITLPTQLIVISLAWYTCTSQQGSITTKTLIDVILTNQPQLFTDCGVYQPELSDHGLVFGFLKEKVKPQQGKIVKFRSSREFDAKKYKSDLIQAPWHVSEIFDFVDDKAQFLRNIVF